MKKELQEFAIKCIEERGTPPTLEELNLHIKKMVQKMNNRSVANFEGYSSEDMNSIIYGTWSGESPIIINILQDNDFEQIPILKQVKHLISILKSEGKIKLTVAGYLPPKIVKELYALGVSESPIEEGIVKLTKEVDSINVQLTRIMVNVMKVAKEQKGAMTLTRAGAKIADNPQELLRELLEAFCSRFNWAYFDLYENEDLGRIGCGFSLILLSIHGNKKQTCEFYATKYFNAFPMLVENLSPRLYSENLPGEHCYTLRTFYRFMLHFGLIEIEDSEMRYSANYKRYITKSLLFDKMFKINTPKKEYKRC